MAHRKKGQNTSDLSCWVASTGIEPVSGASETLILSIVLRGHSALATYAILLAKILITKANTITQKIN